MVYKLKIEEMEAAFRRAAHRALYGTREERSGRFLPREPVISAGRTAMRGALQHHRDPTAKSDSRDRY